MVTRKSPRLFLLTLLLTLLVGVSPARPCAWDSDTLAMEAQQFPDLPQVIAGRFPRFPPLYYQMRLERAAAQIKTNPDDFAAYDDAGMACDRLGRGDEAVEWMARKKARLNRAANPSAPQAREHLYRYHANLGTILAHQWLKNGADRARIGEMKTARSHIARAIEINPDAHFGREKYQLFTMEWIMDPVLVQKHHRAALMLGPYIVGRLQEKAGHSLEKEDFQEAVKGLSGLIVLGNAWESVDVFAALGHLLERSGNASLSHLTGLRCRELVAEGRRSLMPGAPVEAEPLIKELRFVHINPLTGDSERHNKQVFPKLRADAESWQTRRTDYLMKRLRTGHHPDTDPAFWNDFRDTSPPRLEQPWLREWAQRRFGMYWWAYVAAFSLFIGIPAIGFCSFAAAHRLKRYLRERRTV